MRKVTRIYQTTQEINFNSPQKEFSLYWQRFQKSELGQIYKAIPWRSLAKNLQIKEFKKGPARIFGPQGMLALMFLKSYCNCSDRKLIEYLNGNIDFQLFCGIFLGIERLENYKIVSYIRTQLSSQLNIQKAQAVLARQWKPYIDQSNIMLEDATCYESSVRYPTNVKLLWECCLWSHGQLKLLCKLSKVRMPRIKFKEQKDKYMVYSRKRRKPAKDTRSRTRSLLYLLDKLIVELDGISQELDMSPKYYKRLKTIKKVLVQQRAIFQTGKTVPNRIVSIAKSYIRPIVRGKEVKKVEFGAKVNMIQFDGINFIEHLDFNAFHEGIRLPKSIRLGRELFGSITHISADAIYATNANRKYCKGQTIVHGFKRKGRAGKFEQQRKQMASVLLKERATRMEGSFGTEKEHYGLQKIKARTKENEILWIFFGVHMANAVRIAKRIALSDQVLSA